ncbi:MAG: hypothetical protein AB1445_02290 [Bacillota bacterium]
MTAWLDALRDHVREFLSEPGVDVFIGYRAGRRGREVPAFLTRPEQASGLVLGPAASGALAKYVLEEAAGTTGRLGVLARGCEALSLQRLVRDLRVERERLHVVGVPCAGVADLAKLEASLGALEKVESCGERWLVTAGGNRHDVDPSQFMEERCRDCASPWPQQCNISFGQAVMSPASPDYSTVAALEALPADERYAFWIRQFERCLRCFACRQVCPACSCVECSLDLVDPPWLGREITVPAQAMFHYTRALHVAGRCVDCGQCQKVCPVGIPVALLNRKLARDIQELFDVQNPFVPGEIEPLGKFRAEDREEFM